MYISGKKWTSGRPTQKWSICLKDIIILPKKLKLLHNIVQNSLVSLRSLSLPQTCNIHLTSDHEMYCIICNKYNVLSTYYILLWRFLKRYIVLKIITIMTKAVSSLLLITNYSTSTLLKWFTLNHILKAKINFYYNEVLNVLHNFD